MKRYKSIALVVCSLALMAVAGAAPIQAPPDTATLVSIPSGDVSQIAVTRPYTFHDVFGKKGLNIDFRAFGGFSLSDAGRPGAGVAGSVRKTLARETFADIGLYLRTQQDRKLDGGLFVSVGWRL